MWKAFLRRFDLERGWRDMKQVIDLRPVYHRKEERIRAHVIFCWLALLLIWIAETTTGTTWNKITDELGQLTLGTFTGPAGTCRQTPELTPASATSSAPSRSSNPNKIIEAAPASPAALTKPAPAPSDTPVTAPAAISSDQTPDPGTRPTSHLRNAG